MAAGRCGEIVRGPAEARANAAAVRKRIQKAGRRERVNGATGTRLGAGACVPVRWINPAKRIVGGDFDCAAIHDLQVASKHAGSSAVAFKCDVIGNLSGLRFHRGAADRPTKDRHTARFEGGNGARVQVIVLVANEAGTDTVKVGDCALCLADGFWDGWPVFGGIGAGCDAARSVRRIRL